MGSVVALIRDVYYTVSAVWHTLSGLNAQFQAALQRATKAPGLPVPNPSSSYWQDDAPFPSLADAQVDALPDEVDVVIIGSGITAAAAARALLEVSPEPPRILVLEARQLCSGATGRNGGHIKCVPYEVFPRLRKKHGVETARRLLRFQMRHLGMLSEVGERFPLGEVREVETVDFFIHDGDFEKAKKALDETREFVPEVKGEVWEAAEAAKKFGVNEKVKGAISYPAGALWPFRLITSLWEDLLRKHDTLAISTNTPVTQVIKDSSDSKSSSTNYPYVVETPRGSLRCRQVLHATNAFASQLVPSLRGRLAGAHAQMTAQQPGHEFPVSHGLRSWSIIYMPGFDYITQRPDAADGAPGDLMIGGGYFRSRENGLDSIGVYDDSSEREAAFPIMHLYGAMPTVFQPNWGAGSYVKKVWSGIIAMTGDGLPFVGRLPPSSGSQQDNAGEWLAAGYNGEGMVFAWLCGTGVGIMMAGQEDAHLEPEVGRPGGRLADWFPVDEFAYSKARLRSADLRNLANEV
ncbi:FAD dependent oxidoreductase-domain-containing protein [Stachybotrys elegans]|uniref:FAD dependent oxidoreductase-domain-containing protein n=1 Tax=Stachybotrys elegans TaxID=80388 RepID=A0A8K0WT53_9HYPO|nr:FAD dependent oxidoreductase-domain-containing protein [Stachybotrys elegans]